MKKFFFVVFAFVSMQCALAENNPNQVVLSSEDVTEVSANAVNTVYEVDGQTSYNLNGSTSGVGSCYSINPTPPSGTTYSWKIQGGNPAYVYPNGSSCCINMYGAGSYRLSCKMVINGETTESAIYITVMP